MSGDTFGDGPSRSPFGPPPAPPPTAETPRPPFGGPAPPGPGSPGSQPYPVTGHQPYPPPQYLFRPQVRVNGLCVASLVLGVLGIVCFFLYAVPSLLATVFGAIGIAQVKRGGGAQSGRGLGIAGLVLGIVGLALFVFLIAVLAGRWNFTRWR